MPQTNENNGQDFSTISTVSDIYNTVVSTIKITTVYESLLILLS